MTGPRGASTATVERPDRTELGSRRWRCRTGKRGFNERTGTPYTRLQSPTDVVCLVVLGRFRYKLSLRDLAEMLLQRHLVFPHETVGDWEATLAPVLIGALRQRRQRAGRDRWSVDATYVRVQGPWQYLDRAIDRHGNCVDGRLRDTRELAAAEACCRSAWAVTGVRPARMTTEGHDA